MVSVSLFTREWIEIAPKRYFEQKVEVVSLFTREWIEICVTPAIPFATASPSLRGSGLKFLSRLWLPVVTAVSLFTREWIEMFACNLCGFWAESLPLYEGVDWNSFLCHSFRIPPVSLFTREWIEIATSPKIGHALWSPSLRGSGLKLFRHCELPLFQLGLPLYEGVDWNGIDNGCLCRYIESPSLRGSGLKCSGMPFQTVLVCLPLYEGVDWNRIFLRLLYFSFSLPLYEGVDWNISFTPFPVNFISLPLYEGVDWNSWGSAAAIRASGVSLFTREWIEMQHGINLTGSKYVSLFTREWIEIEDAASENSPSKCLPLYEGVDWNGFTRLMSTCVIRLPLYEGVDWNLRYASA